MMTLQINIPIDAEQILQSKAAEAQIDADDFTHRVLNGFFQWVSLHPKIQVAAAKIGWDWELMFAQFVRDRADSLLLDWRLAAASEPTATPQQKADAFAAWANHPRRKMPLLSDEAISRETIYGDLD